MNFIRNIFILLVLFLACSPSPVYAEDLPVVNPVEGELYVSSPFGPRVHPVTGEVGKMHYGIDLADRPAGTNIYAALPGTIIYSGWASGYGNVIYLHSNINGLDVETRYAHCQALLVSEGMEVAAGSLIALLGNTGVGTGPHLHFEIRINGVPVDPAIYLKGVQPSGAVGYGMLPASIKNVFDADYDFGKPLREAIEKYGELCQTAMKNILGIIKWLLITLIIIDLAWSSCLYILDENNGENLIDFLIRKVFLYCMLIYFLANWSSAVANFAKDMFVGFGGLMAGSSAEEAMKAISDPMDIVSKGAHIVAPIYAELFKVTGVFDLWLKLQLWLPSLFFAIVLTVCFFIIALQITMAYLEFYMVMVFGFATFFFSGFSYTRKFAENGINGIFAVSIKMMFFCLFSLMLQMVMSNIQVDSFYTTERAGAKTAVSTPASGEAITSIDQLMAKIRFVESTNRYYIDNGQGYFGAYQIDYGGYNNWENWTAKYVADGGVLETSPRTAEEPQGSTYPWTPNNQDRVAKYIMEGYYAKYGSYEMVARCWNQGEGGAHNSGADEYWRKVSGVDPSTGGFTAPTSVINTILLFKLVFVVLMFVYMGGRVQKIVINQFGGSGFKFTASN